MCVLIIRVVQIEQNKRWKTNRGTLEHFILTSFHDTRSSAVFPPTCVSPPEEDVEAALPPLISRLNDG